MEGCSKEPDRDDAKARHVPRPGSSQHCQRATSMFQALAEGTQILPTRRYIWFNYLGHAEKFCLLVDIFGFIILAVPPAVSVSRLDKVSLTSLEQVRSYIGQYLRAAVKMQLSLSHR